MLEPAAAFLAWLGASLVVLADGRRGLALGTILAAAGIAVLALQSAGPIASGAIAVGGAIAAGRRLASGPEGWEIMPPGSTARLVLCIADGLVALWIAISITSGPGAALRFTVLSVVVLAGARALWSEDAAVLLTATGLLALAAGAATGVTTASPSAWPYVTAGLIAAAIVWLPARTPRAA